jgi:hypothetical protein
MLGQYVLMAYPITLICQAEMVVTSEMAFDHKMSNIDAYRRQAPVQERKCRAKESRRCLFG